MLKRRVCIWFLSLPGLVIATLSGASDFSLGPVSGSILLGEPLDVTVSVSVAAQDNLTPACFSVEVVDGETPVAEHFLNLAVTPGPQPGTGVLRVRSATELHEAVVNLTVRVGCSANLVRRYVLLSAVPGAASANR